MLRRFNSEERFSRSPPPRYLFARPVLERSPPFDRSLGFAFYRINFHVLHNLGNVDPPRKTKPQEVGDFGLRRSVCAGFTGTFRANVIQVMVSSNKIEGCALCDLFPAAAVRWESGKREAF